MAQRMRDRDHDLSANKLDQDAEDADNHAAVIRNVLLNGKGDATLDSDIPNTNNLEPTNE